MSPKRSTTLDRHVQTRHVANTVTGLHLCYELALPRETTATAVAERLRLLHEAASCLPFAKVSALIHVTDGEALGDVNIVDCSLKEFFRLGV